jgi:hypothetical protein
MAVVQHRCASSEKHIPANRIVMTGARNDAQDRVDTAETAPAKKTA